MLGSIPFGPAMPKGEFETMSMPISRNVGTSGQFLVRAAPHVTSSRNRPALTNGAHPLESATAWICPPPFDALPLCDLLHGDMETGAGTGRAVIDLARIGLRVSEELLERLPWRIISDHNAEGVAAYADDIGKVRARIEARLGHEWKAEDRDRDLRDRVAVGLRGCGHLAGSECARAARPVFDDDRLPKMLFGRGCERAHTDIGGTARRPWHDERHGPHRKILRLRGTNPRDKPRREQDAA